MTAQFATDTIFDDRYTIAELLGEGGSGLVYRATENELKRDLALKILQPSFLTDPEFFNRFLREGKVLSRLTHPNLLKLYRFGVANQRIAYIAMELVEGLSLRQTLQRYGTISSDRCASIGIQVCEAIEFAHSMQIIHRDLKPENIMLLEQPHNDFVKVIDFGLARIAGGDNASQQLTHTGEIVGSLHYLSPEQCTGRQANKCSDIYALGCVLYEALSGSPPFGGANPIEVISAHVNSAVPPINHSIENSARWNTCFMKALAKDPTTRYQSMEEFANDLRSLKNGTLAEFTITTKGAHKTRAVASAFFIGAVLVYLCWFYSSKFLVPANVSAIVENQRVEKRKTANLVMEDFVENYRMRRYSMNPDQRIPMLELWKKHFGEKNKKGLELADFWLCMERCDLAESLRYTGKGTPAFQLPSWRKIVTREMAEERSEALRLIDELIVSAETRDDISELLYHRTLLAQLDVASAQRIVLYRTMLADRRVNHRFRNSLRLALREIYDCSGDYAAEEIVLRDCIKDTDLDISESGDSIKEQLYLCDTLNKVGRTSQAEKILLEIAALRLSNAWRITGRRKEQNYLIELLINFSLYNKALETCQYCETDDSKLNADAIGMPVGSGCAQESTHLFLKASALSKLNRKVEAEQLLRLIPLKQQQTRESLMPWLVYLEMEVGGHPGTIIKPCFENSNSDDIGWQTTLAQYFSKTHGVPADTADHLIKKAVQLLMSSNIEESPGATGLVLRVVQALNSMQLHTRAKDILQKALRAVKDDVYAESRTALKLEFVDTFIQMNDIEQAKQMLLPLFSQIAENRQSWSDERAVRAHTLLGRINKHQKKEQAAYQAYKQAWALAGESHDVGIQRKVELANELAEFCRETNRRAEAKRLDEECERLWPQRIRQLLSLEF